MCELGFFHIFFVKDLLKVDKILGLTFFQARKDFEGFKTAFFHLLLLSFVVNGLFTTPVYLPRRVRTKNKKRIHLDHDEFSPSIFTNTLSVFIKETHRFENVLERESNRKRILLVLVGGRKWSKPHQNYNDDRKYHRRACLWACA